MMLSSSCSRLLQRRWQCSTVRSLEQPARGRLLWNACRHQRLLVDSRPRASPDQFDNSWQNYKALENLSKSKVFQQQHVMDELSSLLRDVNGIMAMAPKFPDFDLSGKRLFIEKMEEAVERYEIFQKRLELADDPPTKEFLRHINAQMLEGGYTFRSVFLGFRSTLDQYRAVSDAEERAMADPIAYQKFKQNFKGDWQSHASWNLFSTDMSKVDPRAFYQAQSDPEFYKAIRELAENPSVSVVNRWAQHPKIGPLIEELKKNNSRWSTGPA